MPNPPWLPSLVWTDYRLALLLTVLCPIALLLWAFANKASAIQKLLFIYWRVSSLLAITVYLMIAAIPIGFLVGWFARLLIVLSLWFWRDLNEEVVEQPASPLKLSFMSWRWAISIYCVIGLLTQIPVLRCAFLNQQGVTGDPLCRLWLAPPWAFKELFHHNTFPWFLGFLGIVGLTIYMVYFAYFVLIRLGKQGRSATGQ